MKRSKRVTGKKCGDERWIVETQEEQNSQYVAYLERGWHTVKQVLPNVREVDCALDGLQVLFEKLSDAPISGSRLTGVGFLIGLVRERLESISGQLSVTQQHWKNAQHNPIQGRQSHSCDSGSPRKI